MNAFFYFYKMKVIKNRVLKGKHNKTILTDVYYNQNNQTKTVIIFCHGYKGFKDWGAWNLMAKAFAEAGFFFLKFNFSYNGGTIDQPVDFPDLNAFGNNNYIKELDDLEVIIDWIYNSKEFEKEINNNISLLGHSRGGGIVLLRANEDNRVKSVISLASVCDFGKRTSTIGDLEKWKKEGVKYVLNGRTKQKMPHYYQFYENYIQNKERLDIEKAVKNLEIPHLIIHGNNDTSILIDEAKRLKEWNSSAVYKIVKNADHVFNTSHPWKKETLSNELDNVVKLCTEFLNT